MPSAWQQNYPSGKKGTATKRPESAPGGIIPDFHGVPLSRTRGISRTGPGAGWQCLEHAGRVGQHLRHTCPQGCHTCHQPGWPSSGHGLRFQQQESPFPPSTIPPQQHHKGKPAWELVLETPNGFSKASWRQSPAVEGSPGVQQLAAPAGNSRCSAGALRDPALVFSKNAFCGTRCGNPDKIKELSWQGMGFSHTLPEGLHFLSHPTLLA